MSPSAATLRVPMMLGKIAAGEGAVWILRPTSEERAVLRVDPQTAQIVATIPVAAILPGADIAAGEGGICITEGHRGQRVYRIDGRKASSIVSRSASGAGCRARLPPSPGLGRRKPLAVERIKRRSSRRNALAHAQMHEQRNALPALRAIR